MDNDEDHVCNDYLLLNAEEASYKDLISVLYSSDLEKTSFIDCSKNQRERERKLRRRWLIFISLLVQKILISSTKSLAKVGDLIVMWLNILSINGGFLKLLLCFFKGKVVKPEKSSATFMSIVGFMDKRTELEKKIKYGDEKYISSLSVMASKLVYENPAFIENIVENHWKMKFVGFYNFWNEYHNRPSTQAFMLQDTTNDPNLIVVAFRGTNPFDADAWCTDIDLSWYEFENVGKVHRGFMRALGLQKGKGWPNEITSDNSSVAPQFAYYKMRQLLKEILVRLDKNNKKSKFILTGHSLGGALAILFGGVLVLHEEEWLLDRLEGIYTFGQPRVGDMKFGEFMKKNLKKYEVKYMRYVYCNDMVPRLPYDDKTVLFKHFGPCLYFGSTYKGKVEEEEPNKNYFSILWVIPKNLNAVWELIRGFFLPYFKGVEYKEGWVLRLLRLIGIFIPGLSAHLPQDYVNSVRLGSLPKNIQLDEPRHQD